jgi:hypothetical protein
LIGNLQWKYTELLDNGEKVDEKLEQSELPVHEIESLTGFEAVIAELCGVLARKL